MYVSEADAQAVVPKNGFIKEYLDYISTANDAPIWYHLGAIISAIASLSGKGSIIVPRLDGKHGKRRFNTWTTLVGKSGEGKNSALDPVYDICTAAHPDIMLADDSSVEALHDSLSVSSREGIGILFRDEMGALIDQQKRNYSNTLTNWLLRAYKGGPLTRSTIKGGTKTLKKVSVNLLTGVPPNVLARKTSKEDWRSGFLPRFTFWCSKRERYVAQPIRDPEREEQFADWLFRVCWQSSVRAILTSDAVDTINQWFFDEIEARRSEYPDDIFSLLRRFQDHVILFAAVLTVSYESDTLRDMLEVKPSEVEKAIQIGSLLKDSVIAIFSEVTADQEAHTERDIIEFLRANPHSSVKPIAQAIGLSMSRTSTLLQKISNEYSNLNINWIQMGRGHPTKIYSLDNANIEDVTLALYQQAKEAIIAYLQGHPGSTSSEIAKGIKKSIANTTKFLDQIFQDNEITYKFEASDGRGRPAKRYYIGTQIDA